MRLILTRNPAASGRLEAELGAAGFAVAHCPLAAQRALDDDAALTQAARTLESGMYGMLILTSANTVRALGRVGWRGGLGEVGREPRTQVAVTGAGTARALRASTGLGDPWRPAGEASAAGILAELRAPRPGERLLLPQSAQARSELAAGLTARGWAVDQVPAYRTVALYGPQAVTVPDHLRLVPADEHALGPDGLTPEDVLLVTSSTAAEVWAQLVGAGSGAGARGPRILAIGAPTAQTLRAHGRPAEAVLPSPTAQGVRDALGS